MSDYDPGDYSTQGSFPMIFKLGMVLASVAITAAVLVIAIAE